MIIQPLEHSDLDSLKELQPQGWSDIVPYNAYFIDSSFCYSVKAVIDHKLVGIGTAIIHFDTVWLAHIIVHPHSRNKGIGKAITEKLISKFKGNVYKTIYLIATDLGEPVYRKLGFIEETEYAFYNEGIVSKDEPISSNIVLFHPKFKDEIFLMDKEVSGEDRQNRLKETIETAMVYQDQDTVQGFYFPHLGEGMIIATDARAGIELMKLRLQTQDNAVLPVENKSGIQFLLENKFKETRKAKRMYLGAKREWKPANLYNRVGGQIG